MADMVVTYSVRPPSKIEEQNVIDKQIDEWKEID